MGCRLKIQGCNCGLVSIPVTGNFHMPQVQPKKKKKKARWTKKINLDRCYLHEIVFLNKHLKPRYSWISIRTKSRMKKIQVALKIKLH